jgi:hypothetical protein
MFFSRTERKWRIPVFQDNTLLCVQKCFRSSEGSLETSVGISELLCEIRSSELTRAKNKFSAVAGSVCYEAPSTAAVMTANIIEMFCLKHVTP